MRRGKICMQSGHRVVEAGWGVVCCTQDGEHEIGLMQQDRLVVLHADLSLAHVVAHACHGRRYPTCWSTRRCATGGGLERDGHLGHRLTIEESSLPNTLAAKSCTPCRGGIPLLCPEEAERLLAQAPDWELLDDGRKIQRTYRFKNFREALGFVQQAGELAEAEGHHPDIAFGWGYRCSAYFGREPCRSCGE